MAYYNEIFVEIGASLIHIGSCTGSDTPSYFSEVRSMPDWKQSLEEVKRENGFYPNKDKHPWPWDTYKTSDHLIVLRKNKKKWFEFWKPAYTVWVSADKYDVKDQNKSYFIPANKWCGDSDYNKKDMVILEFPPLKKTV